MNNWNCTVCSGPVMSLGTLGDREHGRCRNCGLDHSRGPTRKLVEQEIENGAAPALATNQTIRELIESEET